MKLNEFINTQQLDENLRDWFGKEKWVRMDTKGNIKGDCARGSESEGKPKCLPQAKAHALGKKGRAAAAQKKRREDPNPERRGAAKNVATKVKEAQLDEACWKGYRKDGMKTMFGKKYPNCVKKKKTNEEIESAVFETLQQRLGSDEIRRIQQMLNVKYNANLDIDGELGPLTIKSIKEFLPKANQGPAPTPEKTTAVQGNQTKLDEKCWDTHKQVGMKSKGGRMVPNCVAKESVEEDNNRIARKPGQPANSKKHSDLYTDENPKGTITGLKFATPEDARASVSKIRNSGRSHAHKMQAAVAMEQRAKAAGKTEAAAVYRRYINANKKTDESMSEGIPFDQCPHCGGKIVHESQLNEKQDACYHKVKSRYKVWPSAYASGALVQCRKKGAANWGNKSK